jgi:hypothetical protein
MTRKLSVIICAFFVRRASITVALLAHNRFSLERNIDVPLHKIGQFVN